MIADDFKIDFINKRIYYKEDGSGKVYTVRELYSYLQDVFDELENMQYKIPIKAESFTKYTMINGWTIDGKAKKYLKGGSLVVSSIVTENSL